MTTLAWGRNSHGILLLLLYSGRVRNSWYIIIIIIIIFIAIIFIIY